MTMAARKLPREGEPNPISIRLSADVLEGLDAWLAETNDRRVSKLARTDLIRGVLAWAIKNRPEWEEPRFQVELWRDGKVIARQGVVYPPGGSVTFYFEGGPAIEGHLRETRVDSERLVLIYDVVPPAGRPPAIHVGK